MYVKIASGRVSTVYNSGAVTAGTSYNGGFAYDSSGKLQVDTAAVPATKSISQGISRKSDGVLCVNTHDPSLVSYAYLPGVAGNNITTPSKTITGNMTLTYDVALDAYPPAAAYEFPSKRSGLNGFRLTYQNNGIFLFRVSNGAGENGAFATAAYTATAGSRHTFTVNWLDNTSVEFLADGVRIGNVVALAVVMSNASTAFIAADASLAGKVYRCTLTDGAGTTYYDMNPADSAETSTNGATFVSGGDTYTLNNTGADPAILLSPARGHGGLLTDNSGALYVHVTDAVSGAVGGVPVTAKGAVAVSAVT